MEYMPDHDLTKEILTAVEKYAQLSVIQLCDKMVKVDLDDFHTTIECMEALMMRLIDMPKNEQDDLLNYAETKCEEGNIEYASVLNIFVIKDLCNL